MTDEGSPIGGIVHLVCICQTDAGGGGRGWCGCGRGCGLGLEGVIASNCGCSWKAWAARLDACWKVAMGESGVMFGWCRGRGYG